MGGPLFRDDDDTIRGKEIPREFWQVIAFVESGMLKATASGWPDGRGRS